MFLLPAPPWWRPGSLGRVGRQFRRAGRRSLVLRRAVVLLLLALLPACHDISGDGGADPVKPVVVPPEVGGVKVESPEVERAEVVRVALKEPLALPPTQIDTFNQSDGVVDILWVIDDSGSMANQRTGLADNFQA